MKIEEWNLKSSDFGKLTLNPLRVIYERNIPEPNPEKSTIMLQPGDCTTFRNFPPEKGCIEALKEAIVEDLFSYDESAGIARARQAVADYSHLRGKITSADVILTSGCSMAIEICFKAIANRGDNILLPRPAWNYTTWFNGLNVEGKFYDLDPFDDWQIDLKHLESLINEKTRAIVINNPGNPCGNVFSKEHILDILEIAERYKLPIIADEVYEFFVFPGNEFHSVASLSENVPVLTCSGLTKRFLMPGIRMGWILINDRGDKLKDVRLGLANIAGRNFGPNSTIQLALPKILKCVPQSYFDDAVTRVGNHAKIVYNLLCKCQVLRPIMPRGAMYMMIGINHSKLRDIPTSLIFMRKLAMEQSVFVFPGEPFSYPGFFRIILTAPEEVLVEFCGRIKEFCEKYQNEY